MEFGTNNFTVETWVYLTAAQNHQYIFDTRDNSHTSGWAFGWGLNTVGELQWFNGITQTSIVSDPSTTDFNLNTWYHVAYVRNGTTGTIYVNGQSVASATDNGNYNVIPTTGTIGSRYTIVSNASYMTGYLSNLRIVNGTAVYTSNFTPPTLPLSNISGTTLLIQNGITDSSNNNFTITDNGATVSNTQTPFVSNVISFDSISDYAIHPRNSTDTSIFFDSEFNYSIHPRNFSDTFNFSNIITKTNIFNKNETFTFIDNISSVYIPASHIHTYNDFEVFNFNDLENRKIIYNRNNSERLNFNDSQFIFYSVNNVENFEFSDITLREIIYNRNELENFNFTDELYINNSYPIFNYTNNIESFILNDSIKVIQIRISEYRPVPNNLLLNHIQNNHLKSSKSIYQVGQIINTKIGPAKILDISGPHFGPDIIYWSGNENNIKTLTLMLLKNGKVFQTKVNTFVFTDSGVAAANDINPDSVQS